MSNLKRNIAALTIALVPITVSGAASAATPPDAAQCLVAAHRGNTQVPPAGQTVATENTIKSETQAIAAGADVVEGDAEATSDDTIMLMHDATVDRTTNGTGTVRSKTGTQVKALKTDDGTLGGVPYLSQTIALLNANPNVQLLLELKAPGGTAWWNRLVTNLTPILDRVTLNSDTPSRLDQAKALMPGVKTAIQFYAGHGQPTDAEIRPYGGLVDDQTVFTQAYMDSLDPAFRTYPYVVDSSANFSKYAGQVTAVITDIPGPYKTFTSTFAGCQ